MFVHSWVLWTVNVCALVNYLTFDYACTYTIHDIFWFHDICMKTKSTLLDVAWIVYHRWDWTRIHAESMLSPTAIHHSLTNESWDCSWADRLATASYTREFVTESPVLGKVREQLADLEQSSLRNDNFLGARSLFKFRVFEENSPFVDYTSHAHASCIRSQTLTAIPPSSFRSYQYTYILIIHVLPSRNTETSTFVIYWQVCF